MQSAIANSSPVKAIPSPARSPLRPAAAAAAPRCSPAPHTACAAASSPGPSPLRPHAPLQRSPTSCSSAGGVVSPAPRASVRAAALSSSGAGGGSPPSPDARPAPEAGPPPREVERSALVNEEAVYFIFQLDLDTQLQRALNYEAYEQAKDIRSKRERVDQAVAAMLERKAANAEGGAEQALGSAPLAAVDFAAEGLRLRTAMARAVEAEDYKEAARLRDTLAALEAEARKAEARGAAVTGGAAFAPRLRLGQRVVHTRHGYRGVVTGWDARCCEGEEWVAASGAAGLAQGLAQPFYHVLVDQRDWAYDAYQPPVAYVAQELLWAPELGGAPPAGFKAKAPAATSPASGGSGSGAGGAAQAVLPPGTSWVEAAGPEPLAHPYAYILFLGQDARGDYLPCRQLRDKYRVARRDVHAPGQEEEGGDGGSGGRGSNN